HAGGKRLRGGRIGEVDPLHGRDGAAQRRHGGIVAARLARAVGAVDAVGGGRWTDLVFSPGRRLLAVLGASSPERGGSIASGRLADGAVCAAWAWGWAGWGWASWGWGACGELT